MSSRNVMSPSSPSTIGSSRGSHDTARRARSRSRSPRMSLVFSAIGRGEGETSYSSTSRRFASRAFHFDLDDLMSSFLSTPRPPPISQTRLAEIPNIVITQEQTSSNTQCSVCFDEFKLRETDVRKLPCNHLFHEKCIFPWLRINGTCPVCRASLIQGGEDEAAAQADAPADASSNFGNCLHCHFGVLRKYLN